MMTPSASEIRNRVAAVYKTCTTYRDTGESTTVFIKGLRAADRRTTAWEFRTAFLRPDRFCFESTERKVDKSSKWSRHVVSSDQIQSWTLMTEVEKSIEVFTALVEPTGVSGGTVHTASILVPLLGLPIWHPDGSLAPDEELDGVRCYKLVHSGDEEHESETIWISCETHLILRVDAHKNFEAEHLRARHEERIEELRPRAAHDARAAHMLASFEAQSPYSIQGFRTEQTIRYYPSIDVHVDEEEFAFDPPT